MTYAYTNGAAAVRDDAARHALTLHAQWLVCKDNLRAVS